MTRGISWAAAGIVLVTGLFTLPAGAEASAPLVPMTETVRDAHAIWAESMPATGGTLTGHGRHVADFDGDGIDDVVTGYEPNHTFTAPDWTGAGGVVVRYSHLARTDFINGKREGPSEFGFGTVLTTGDFNHDGYDDLAIGAPYENQGVNDDIVEVGGVWILYGSANGLQPSTAQHFNEDTPGIPGTAEADDFFGQSLAAGDLNGDGYADLAVGSPGESVGTVQEAGAVTVLYGSHAGLTATGSVSFTENTTGVPDTAEAGDSFGWSLAIGHVTNHTYADLVVGTPSERMGSTSGMLLLFRGSASGLRISSGATEVTALGAQVVTQTTQMLPYSLGQAVATGDVNGDGLDEVIATAPGASYFDGTNFYQGVVMTFTGRSTGLSVTGRTWISAESSSVPGSTVFPDAFGSTIAVGDVTGDGHADLIVGDQARTTSGHADAGTIWLIRGSSKGFTGTGSVAISEDTAGVPDAAEVGDEFGASVAVLNLDGKGGLDVAVGAPGEMITGDISSSYPSGAVFTFHGGSTGLTAPAWWTGQSVPSPDMLVLNVGGQLAH